MEGRVQYLCVEIIVSKLELAMSSIIDNRNGITLLSKLQDMNSAGSELRIATAFFSIEAFRLLADSISDHDRVRILFGDEANKTQRQ